MPTKPSPIEIGAQKAMEENPSYGHDCLEAIINDNPDLAKALLDRGLVEEVK